MNNVACVASKMQGLLPKIKLHTQTNLFECNHLLDRYALHQNIIVKHCFHISIKISLPSFTTAIMSIQYTLYMYMYMYMSIVCTLTQLYITMILYSSIHGINIRWQALHNLYVHCRLEVNWLCTSLLTHVRAMNIHVYTYMYTYTYTPYRVHVCPH